MLASGSKSAASYIERTAGGEANDASRPDDVPRPLSLRTKLEHEVLLSVVEVQTVILIAWHCFMHRCLDRA